MKFTSSLPPVALLVLTATASPVAVPDDDASTTPTLRGGFTANCDFYQVTSHGAAYGHLQATCNLDPGNPDTEIASTLDLSLCLGNYNNNLAWGYLGGAFASCTGCTSRRFQTRYLDCDCGSVDLNEGVYVTAAGAVACYDQVGSSYTVPYKREA